MKKSLMAVLALICCICFAEEQKIVLAKSGAVLELYSATVRKVRPDANQKPIAVVVDHGLQFCHDNMTLIPDVKKYRQEYLFKVWKGYVDIPADGTYVISMSYDHYDKWGTMGRNDSNTILEISGNTVMFISQVYTRGMGNKDLRAAKSLELKQGSYEFKIIHRSGYRNDIFTLKLSDNAKPRNEIKVTPAIMAHVE